MYLILVDAFIKWPEVFEIFNMSTNCTIEKLRECFAHYVIIILHIIFSDNGRQFVSEEFENFYKNNDISKKKLLLRIINYGLAENAVDVVLREEDYYGHLRISVIRNQA